MNSNISSRWSEDLETEIATGTDMHKSIEPFKSVWGYNEPSTMDSSFLSGSWIGNGGIGLCGFYLPDTTEDSYTDGNLIDMSYSQNGIFLFYDEDVNFYSTYGGVSYYTCNYHTEHGDANDIWYHRYNAYPIVNYNFTDVRVTPSFTVWDGTSKDQYGRPINTVSINCEEIAENLEQYPYCIAISYGVYYKGEPCSNVKLGCVYFDGCEEMHTGIMPVQTETSGMLYLGNIQTHFMATKDIYAESSQDKAQYRFDNINNAGINVGSQGMWRSFNKGAFWSTVPDSSWDFELCLPTRFALNYAGLCGFYMCAPENVNEPYDSELTYINRRDANGTIYSDLLTVSERRANDWLLQTDEITGERYTRGGDTTITTPVGGSDNIYTDSMKYNDGGLSPYGAFTTMWCLNKNQLKSFGNEIFGADDTKAEQLATGVALMGANPIDAVISCRMYPINIPERINLGREENIKFGRTEMDTKANRVLDTPYCIVNGGEFSVTPHFKNYLDYENTNISLYLPYCGTFKLDTKQVMNRYISIVYVIDFYTGLCQAYVTSSPNKDASAAGKSVMILCVQGTIGISITCTGTNNSLFASQYVNATYAQKNAELSFASSITNAGMSVGNAIATGSLVGPAQGAMAGASGLSSVFDISSSYNNMKQTQFNKDMSTNASSPIITGACTPMNWLRMPQKAYLIIDRPIVKNPKTYGRSNGYVYMQTSTLSKMHGFTTVLNPNLSDLKNTVGADASRFADITNDEITKLEQILANGIICP